MLSYSLLMLRVIIKKQKIRDCVRWIMKRIGIFEIIYTELGTTGEWRRVGCKVVIEEKSPYI
jgi:hypothetical protein